MRLLHGPPQRRVHAYGPAGEDRACAMMANSQGTSLEDRACLKMHENDFPLVKLVEGDKNAPLVLRMPAAR
jgi:hypothetical protein